MMRFADFKPKLSDRVTEDRLRVLRDGDVVLIPARFLRWERSGSTNYGIAKETAVLRVGDLKFFDHTLMHEDVEVRLLGASVREIARAPIEAQDYVAWDGEFAGRDCHFQGRVLAVDGPEAFIEQTHPASDSRKVVAISDLTRVAKTKAATSGPSF